MKKLFTVAVLLIITNLSIAQLSTIVSTPVPVISSTLYGNYWPRIVLAGGGEPVVIWGSQVPYAVYSSYMNSGAFSIPIQLNPAGINPFVQLWSGAEIAAVGDSIFVTYKTDPVDTGKVYIQRSIDGGISYSDTIRVENIGNDISRFPSVQIDFGGNPVVNFMRFDSTFNHPKYVVAHSYDAGLTFNPDVNATANVTGQVCECCPAVMNIKGNREIIMFRNNDNNIRTIWTAISYDDGQSFPASGQVDQTNWQVLSCPSDMPSGVVNGDTLIVVWRSAASGQSKVYIGTMSLTTYQVGFNAPIHDFISGTLQDSPFIVGNGDTLGVVWQQSVSGDAKILFSYSVTGPAGLGINIDTISMGLQGFQTSPHMTYADGVFHIVYTYIDSTEVMYQTVSLVDPTGIHEVAQNTVSGVQVLEGKSDDYAVQFISNVSQNAVLTVYSIKGEKMSEEKISMIKGRNNYPLETKNCAAGLYFVQLKTAGNYYNTKFVVH